MAEYAVSTFLIPIAAIYQMEPRPITADGFTIFTQDAVAFVCPNPAAKQNVPEIGELGESYGPH